METQIPVGVIVMFLTITALPLCIIAGFIIASVKASKEINKIEDVVNYLYDTYGREKAVSISTMILRLKKKEREEYLARIRKIINDDKSCKKLC